MRKALYTLAFLGALLTGPVIQTPAQAATDQPAANPKRPVSPGQAAARERQKRCAAEWKLAKAGGKTEGMKWPQFWSACNTRLKAQAQ
jgi:hypothetical protein